MNFLKWTRLINTKDTTADAVFPNAAIPCSWAVSKASKLFTVTENVMINFFANGWKWRFAPPESSLAACGNNGTNGTLPIQHLIQLLQLVEIEVKFQNLVATGIYASVGFNHAASSGMLTPCLVTVDGSGQAVILDTWMTGNLQQSMPHKISS